VVSIQREPEHYVRPQYRRHGPKVRRGPAKACPPAKNAVDVQLAGRGGSKSGGQTRHVVAAGVAGIIWTAARTGRIIGIHLSSTSTTESISVRGSVRLRPVPKNVTEAPLQA